MLLISLYLGNNKDFLSEYLVHILPFWQCILLKFASDSAYCCLTDNLIRQLIFFFCIVCVIWNRLRSFALFRTMRVQHLWCILPSAVGTRKSPRSAVICSVIIYYIDTHLEKKYNYSQQNIIDKQSGNSLVSDSLPIVEILSLPFMAPKVVSWRAH